METQSYESVDSGAFAAVAGVIAIVYIAIFVVLIVSMWKVFTKAGKPGWAAIIPIYNLIVLLEIVNKPVWWIIFMLIPFVNFIFFIYLYHLVSTAFGQGIGMTILLILVIGWPILAFGSAQYQGASSTPASI
jgi:hypothetical protein